MAHLALYRKYRPTGFDSLIGQEAIKTTLQNALETNKVSHAYLFSGPRGIGKTSSAKILAKALNCLEPNGIEPCGKCESCKESNPDIVEMDAASNNGVDEIRDLREKVMYSPVYGKYKVYIIDEVHMLTTQAFNALLKTLEEPPSHAVFILATTEPHKIPLTILSRCQRYDFRRIAQEDIVMRMEKIVESENASVEKEALQLIAQIAAGGMRDALSLLDQSISNANGPVTLQSVINLTGAVDTRKIGKLIETIATNNVEESLEHFNHCFQNGQEPKFFVEEMMIYLRDILLYEKLGSRATLKKGLTDPSFHQVAKSISTNRIYLYLDLLQETMSKMKFHHDIQLLMEMTIVKMIHGEENRLQSQIDELKQLLQNGQIPVPSTATLMVAESKVDEEPSLSITLENVREEVSSTLVEQDESFLSNFSLESLKEEIPSQEEIPSPVIEVKETVVVEVEEEPPFPPSVIDEEPPFPPSVKDEEPPFPPSVIDEEPPFPPTIIDDVLSSNSDTEEINFLAMAEQAYNNGETWVEFVDEDTASQTEPVNETLVEPVNEPKAEQMEDTKLSSPVLLSADEEQALQSLKKCSKEQKTEFANTYNAFFNELKKANISTATLFREFKVKAVSDEVIIISHLDTPKVKLMKKVKNKSIIESLLEEVYRPLKLEIISENEWNNIMVAYKQ